MKSFELKPLMPAIVHSKVVSSGQIRDVTEANVLTKTKKKSEKILGFTFQNYDMMMWRHMVGVSALNFDLLGFFAMHLNLHYGCFIFRPHRNVAAGIEALPIKSCCRPLSFLDFTIMCQSFFTSSLRRAFNKHTKL